MAEFEANQKRLIEIIEILHQRSGERMSEVFWKLTDFLFWDTMQIMEQLCQRLGFKENLNPFSEKECSRNKERALKQIAKSKDMDLIQEFMSIWVEAAFNGKDIISPLMSEKKMRGALDQGARGQFFTPECVSKLLSAITNPKTGEWDGITKWVIEPSAGFGSIILKDWAMHRESFENDASCLSRVYIAQEISLNTAKVCYLQMFLSGMTGYVDCMDTLSERREQDRWFTPNYLIMLLVSPEPLMWFQTAHRGSWTNICMKAITQRTKSTIVGNPPFDTSVCVPFLLKMSDWMNSAEEEVIEQLSKGKRIAPKVEGEPPTIEEIVVTADTQWKELVNTAIEAAEFEEWEDIQENSMFINHWNRIHEIEREMNSND